MIPLGWFVPVTTSHLGFLVNDSQPLKLVVLDPTIFAAPQSQLTAMGTPPLGTEFLEVQEWVTDHRHKVKILCTKHLSLTWGHFGWWKMLQWVQCIANWRGCTKFVQLSYLM